MKLRRAGLGLCAGVASLLAVGAGVGVAPAATTAAPSAATTTGVRHVSPAGIGAHRAPSRTANRSVEAISTITAKEWVSNSVPVGSNTSCANPGFSTISAALLAAPSGAIVNVCAGTYNEQLAITQSVTLHALGSVTVVGPSAPADNLTACDADGGSQPNQDVVDICGAITVGITGFTIQGGWPSTVCYDSMYGVAVLGGAHLTMSATMVENIGGDPMSDGCQGGVGIEVGLATSATTADPGVAALTNDTVTTYQKNGITVDGAASSSMMNGITVTGVGPTTAIAQNGIQVSDGAKATIKGSLVSGDECNNSVCGPNGFTQTQSCGILIFDAGKVAVSSTNVTTSDIGVYNLEDYAWAYYTPPSPFTAVLETLSGMGLTNRYENAYLDEGKSSVSSSTLSGGEVGVEAAQASYQTTKDVSTLTGDTISGTSEDAILVASDQSAGDLPVSLTATSSSLDTTNAGGVANQSTSALKVTGDWWGDPTGPSVWNFGSGSSVSSDVNFFPWATDSSFSTMEPCTTGTNATTTGDQVVLCATAGTSNAYLANNGSGRVLLLGNQGNDQLVGSSSGVTWIISGTRGANVINGNNGSGFIQVRGDTNDTLFNTSGYTVAAT